MKMWNDEFIVVVFYFVFFYLFNLMFFKYVRYIEDVFGLYNVNIFFFFGVYIF